MTRIIYYTTDFEENPVDDFLNSLSEKQQRKILRITSYVRLYGLDSVIPHIKKLVGTPLWEIRILGKDNIRILYVAIKDDTVLLLHGFVKKSQKTPDREITLALHRLKEWIFKSPTLD